MSLTRRSAVTLLGAGLSAPFLSRHSFAAAEYAWKFGHGFPPTHPIHVRASEAAAKIKQETDGQVDIAVFPNSQLGGDSDLLAQVRSGALEFFSTGGLIFATLVPVASINGTGFAFKDYATVWSAMDGALGALVRDGFAKVGLHAFERIWDNGFRQITTSNRPIKTPDDLKNLKLRVPVSQVYVSLFKALGAAPASINLAEVYTALQTGVVDGQENPLVVVDTAKFYEVQKFCSLTNHVWDGSWIVANARAWRGLPDPLKAVVSRNFNDIALQQRQDIAKLNEDLKQSLTQKGLTFTDAAPAPFREALRKAGFYSEWRGRYGDAAWAVLEQFSGKLT